jgi:hypothetical protein
MSPRGNPQNGPELFHIRQFHAQSARGPRSTRRARSSAVTIEGRVDVWIIKDDLVAQTMSPQAFDQSVQHDMLSRNMFT